MDWSGPLGSPLQCHLPSSVPQDTGNRVSSRKGKRPHTELLEFSPRIDLVALWGSRGLMGVGGVSHHCTEMAPGCPLEADLISNYSWWLSASHRMILAAFSFLSPLRFYVLPGVCQGCSPTVGGGWDFHLSGVGTSSPGVPALVIVLQYDPRKLEGTNSWTCLPWDRQGHSHRDADRPLGRCPSTRCPTGDTATLPGRGAPPSLGCGSK